MTVIGFMPGNCEEYRLLLDTIQLQAIFYENKSFNNDYININKPNDYNYG